MTSLSLPFFSFDVSAIRTAYYPGASLFLDGHLSKCSKRFRAVSGKERGTRARSSDGGDRACFRKRTRGKRGELFSLFIFPRQFFVRSLRLLVLYYPGSYWGTQREVNWQEAPLLSLVSFVCFYFSFCFQYMSFFFCLLLPLFCVLLCLLPLYVSH